MRITDNYVKNDYSDVLNLLLQANELRVSSSSNNKFFSLTNIESILVAKYDYFCLRHSNTVFDIFCSYRPSYSKKKLDTLFDLYGFSPFNDNDNNVSVFSYEILSSNVYSLNIDTPWSFFFKLDIFFYIVELFIFFTVIYIFFSNLSFKLSNVTNLYQLSVSTALSYYEVIGLVTSSALLVIFDIIVAALDEDITDMALVFVLIFVIGSIVGFTYGLGLLKAYSSLSPVSNGESTKRVYISDAINVFLCLLRVFLCWTRYIFYDLQVEHVDMALQYTDEIGLVFTNESKGLYFFFMSFLFCLLDLLFFGIQILMCLFKFGIAVFLLWLILDLFLLRVSARVSEKWLINSIISRLKNI